MQNLSIHTSRKREVVDITDQCVQFFPPNGEGAVHLFLQHTTAALTTADLDPGTDLDLLDALDGILPDVNWRHPHDPKHTPDHILASIIGPSVTVLHRGGSLVLGTWQRIILIEFDGPRERTVTASTC